MPRTFSIRWKLLLLAGIPVLGALVLAAHVTKTAQEQTATAVALVSIEDLATLSAQMNLVVDQLGRERSVTALKFGEPEDSLLRARQLETDEAIAALERFLSGRKLAALPPRLAGHLNSALRRLHELRAFRQRSRTLDFGNALAFYNQANSDLIAATAALNRLSNDGEMLRSIAALVSVLEVKERVSRQYAVLNHAFRIREFPPGSYRMLVKLVTEEEDYVGMLKLTAPDEVVALYEKSAKRSAVKQAAKLRQSALDTIEDELDVDADLWFTVQGDNVQRLRRLEVSLNQRVQQIATDKIAEATRAANLYYGISGGVLLVSVLLTALMARGISRSISSLSDAALAVRQRRDYAVRAEKRSNDELGALTETFNDMLSGIEAREAELAEHRNNLERLVEERTEELQERNAALRLVLDTVDQGLATVSAAGTLVGERSAAFDHWFGAPPDGAMLSAHLGRDDSKLARRFRLAWNQFEEGLLPAELALAQLPGRIELSGRSYALDYKPLGDGKQGVLLVVSDITLQLQSQRAEAEQRQFLTVVERIIKDRSGFAEFMAEGDRLVRAISDVRLPRDELLRALHTLKGNCGVFEIYAVAAVLHETEGRLIAEGRQLAEDERKELVQSWQGFANKVRGLLGEVDPDRTEVSRRELGELLSAARGRASHAALATMIERLSYERVEARFHRIAGQIRALAHRLGKGSVRVEVDAGDVRLPATTWSPFWSAFAHVVRNAVDHGLEPPAERVKLGKREQGTVRLVSTLQRDTVVIEITDDGSGIDWERVRQMAKERGMNHDSPADLEVALFADGTTTAREASEVSGRGVGMGAVHAAVQRLSGEVSVRSQLGQGTTVRICVPMAVNEVSELRVEVPA